MFENLLLMTRLAGRAFRLCSLGLYAVGFRVLSRGWGFSWEGVRVWADWGCDEGLQGLLKGLGFGA